MTWPRRFLAVPTSALRVDAQISAQSPKGYSERELQEMASTIPAIYDRIAEGFTQQDFLNMTLSSDAKERSMGKAYSDLFRDSPPNNPMVATYDGSDLVVDKGNHRVRAAREIGVPVLPVWVCATSEIQLDRVEHACARRIEREGATAYHVAHTAHMTSLGHERTQSREDLGKHRQLNSRMPEHER